MKEYKGFMQGAIGTIASTPLLGAALSGLGYIGGGIMNATQSLVSTGYMGSTIKSMGLDKLFKK